MTNFEKAMHFVLKWEGGYSNHPKDPGGETNLGITWRTLRTAIERGIVPADTTIRNLTVPLASLIYKAFYFDQYNCGKYELPMAVAVFDAFVQHNPKRVRERMLEGSTNWREFLSKRKDYYTSLIVADPTQKVFQKGWINRMNDLTKYCEILEME